MVGVLFELDIGYKRCWGLLGSENKLHFILSESYDTWQLASIIDIPKHEDINKMTAGLYKVAKKRKS